MSLADFPKADLAHKPTPLEPMTRLGRHLGLESLYVKRDDCTGLAMGGNKARQLEYYFGEALAQGADTVIITGAVQSNYLRMTAAAAAKLGLDCHIQLEDRVKGMGDDYHRSGNVLLNHIHGAFIHHYPEGEDEAGADAALDEIAAQLTERGGRPYIIPLGPGHPPLGALGYVEAAAELLQQAEQLDLVIDKIVVASGSALTHAGLLTGMRMHGSNADVIGICVRRDAEQQAPRVLARAREVAEMIGRAGLVEEADIWVDDQVFGPGYGQINEETAEAVILAARYEGLLVDPVYSGKTLAGLIAMDRGGEVEADETVVFWHTGGTPAIFGYRAEVERFLNMDGG